jgi:hypothetical protein
MVSLVVEPFQHFDQDARDATRLDSIRETDHGFFGAIMFFHC